MHHYPTQINQEEVYFVLAIEIVENGDGVAVINVYHLACEGVYPSEMEHSEV